MVKQRLPWSPVTTPTMLVEEGPPLPAEPSPRPLRSLVASASRLTSQKVKAAPGRASTAKSWQSDAWDMYDLVGEQRFLASTLSSRMSQAKFFVGRLADDQTEVPEPVTDRPDVTVILDYLGGSPAGRSQIIGRLGANLFVAGDAWLAGIPSRSIPGSPREGEAPVLGPDGSPVIDLEDLEWSTLSVSEVNSTPEGLVSIKFGSDKASEVQVDPDEVFLIRVWRPHPRHWWEADSPTRSSLPVLRELVGLTMHISAQIDSRLAGAGLLIVPQSAQRAFRLAAGLTADPGPDEGENDPFTEALMDAMLTPIGDRANASALVPLIVTAPDEVTDNFNYLTFAKPLDTEARALRDEAIRRLALGQDAPPEMLLGTGGMNHWGAWLVREDVVTTHIEPPLALICDAITTQYLWPALEEMGYSHEEAREFVVWYDVSHMVTRPNRASDAQALYDRGAVSDGTLRSASGFDDSDAPPTEALDLATSMAFEMVKQNPSLLVAPGLASVIEQIKGAIEGTPVAALDGPADAGDLPAGDEPPTDSERLPEPGGNDLPGTSDDDADVG